MSPRRIHLIVPFVAGAVVALLWRRRVRAAAPPPVLAAPPAPPPATDPPPTFAEPKLRQPAFAAPRFHHRLAVATFAVVFFAGAAFSAGAGDRVGALLDEGAPVVDTATPDTATPDTATPDTATPDTASTEAQTPDAAAPATEPADLAPADVQPGATQPETAAAVGSPLGEAAAPETAPETAKAQWTAPAPAAAHVVHRAVLAKPAVRSSVPVSVPASVPTVAKPAPVFAATPQPAPEVDEPGSSAVVWINAPLPDAIPPNARLSARFADRLRSASLAYGVDWALLLGAYRAEGSRGSLRAVAGRLQAAQGGSWSRVLASSGDTGVADRAVALAHYNRMVGLFALVDGFDAAKHGLSVRLLADPRVLLLPAGRADIEAGRVDVRVLAVIGYLADTFGSVTVSCLVTGHRLYARPGVVSAHIFGRAVDIASLDGTPIAGNQEPGGLTEHAVRALLLLPPEARPQQVISLLGLGGPSFPLADHADHIHVGF